MVSIIITTKNSEKFIADCIIAIKKSTYQDFEIIIVDNFSDDRTCKIAMAHDAIVYKQGPERSAQRNFGVRQANGDYVLILDVDMYIHPELLEHCFAICDLSQWSSPQQYMGNEHNNNDSLYIPEIIIDQTPENKKPFWIRVRNYERSFYDGTRVDAVRFIRKSYWVDYNVELTGAEDWDHDRRIKGQKGISKYPLYHNEGGFEFIKYLKKKAYYCQWLDMYKRIRYNKGDKYLPELDPKYRYWGVFMENGKWKKVIRHPIQFVAMMMLKVMLGITFVCVKKK